MPTGPSDSPASDQSLSPEQRERRMLAWTRWILALCLLVAGATLLKLVATVIRYAFGFDIVMRLPLAFFGFLILFAALILALLTAAVRNRPSWPIALWGVRIFMVGVYALFLPAIGVAILAFLRSAGMVFGADVDAAIHLGLLLFGDSVFLFVALTLAFCTFYIEAALQQAREQRATHPRPS